MPVLSPRHAALGNAIRELRRERGLSQEDAAFRCRLDRSYFGAIERGQKNVAITNIWRIADGLSVRASELLERAEAVVH